MSSRGNGRASISMPKKAPDAVICNGNGDVDLYYQNSLKVIVDFALLKEVSCVVIGPEDPLSLGFSDSFWKNIFFKKL